MFFTIMQYISSISELSFDEYYKQFVMQSQDAELDAEICQIDNMLGYNSISSIETEVTALSDQISEIIGGINYVHVR